MGVNVQNTEQKQLVKKNKGVKLFLPRLPKSLAKKLLQTKMGNIMQQDESYSYRQKVQSSIRETVCAKAPEKFGKVTLADEDGAISRTQDES